VIVSGEENGDNSRGERSSINATPTTLAQAPTTETTALTTGGQTTRDDGTRPAPENRSAFDDSGGLGVQPRDSRQVP
jgi:hypothetical protein